jgi:DNA gyrase/topoisomerase IV subunit A
MSSTEWLSLRLVQRAALDGYVDLVGNLRCAESEADALDCVRATFGCSDDQADQILGLQVRRLCQRDRSTIANEIDQLNLELAVQETLPRVTSDQPRVERGIEIRVTSPPRRSDPVPAMERARRRAQAVEDRRAMLLALAQFIRDPMAALQRVRDASDPSTATESLAAIYGWTSLQAQVVIDMQFRGFVRDNLRRIEAELGSEL